jgi:hypothetical protein
MAELSLGIDAPGIQAAIQAFGSLNKEQQAAVLYSQGLLESHRKLTGESRQMQREMQQVWRSVASDIGGVTSIVGVLNAALAAARQQHQELMALTDRAGQSAKAGVANFAQLAQMKQLIGKPQQAAQIRDLITGMVRTGEGKGSDLYAAAGAAVGMGATMEDTYAAMASAAEQKRLVPTTDAAGFAKAYMASRKAGIGKVGSTNLAVLAGPGGGESIASLAAMATASGVSLTDLMALQTTVADELGKDPGEVQGMVARAVAGGVKLDEIVSGNIRGSTRRKLKNARGIALLGAIEQGRDAFAANRAQYRALAEGQQYGDLADYTRAQLTDADRDELAVQQEIDAREAGFVSSPDARLIARKFALAGKMREGRLRLPSLGDRDPDVALRRAQAIESSDPVVSLIGRADFTGALMAITDRLVNAILGTPAANARAMDTLRPPIPNNEPDHAPR